MLIFSRNGQGVNMDAIHLADFLPAVITAASASQVSVTLDANNFATVGGTGLFVDMQTGETAGSITSLLIHRSAYDISFDAVNVPLRSFLLWVGADATQEAFAAMMNGRDVVQASAFADLVRTYGGDDEINGGGGADTIFAGAGNDTIYGFAHEVGASYVRGDEGDDVVTAGAGFDDINGNQGNDTLHGGLGDDWVVGGRDNDVQTGDAGGDVVWGNLGADTIDGGDGADQVRGGQGDDSVSGGAGDDYVSGDRGNDTIAGGAGADLFHGSQDAGIDRVLDFNLAEGDRVMLDPGTTYTVSQVGADTVIDMGAPGQQVILVGVQLSTLAQGWVFAA
jgi:Ca2+-binding RTX toxin-like protein